MKLTEKRAIGRALRQRYNVTSQVRFGSDHSVNVRVDPMPNTSEEGWIFAGWDTELLQEIKQAQNS